MATRPLTSALATANAQPNITALLFLELNFLSGTVRFTTAGHDVAWDGFTWTGVGVLGSIGGIREDVAMVANGITVKLSGVDGEMVALALQETYRNRLARMWYGVINDAGSLIISPLMIFSGRMDNMTVTDGQNATVSLALENEFATWNKPRVRRFSDADQKSEYPSDTIFEFMTVTSITPIIWGKG